MSEFAARQLNQARAIAREGNLARAVELLEQARVLVGDDAGLREQVLAELAELYERTGRQKEAAQCRAQLPRREPAFSPIAPRSPAPLPPPIPQPLTSGPASLTPPPGRALLYGGIAVAAVLLLTLTVFAVRFMFPNRAVAGTDPAAARVVAPPVTTQPTLAISPPVTTQPVAAPVVVRPTLVAPASAPTIADSIFSPISPTTSPGVHASAETALRSTSKLDRQDLLKETVGLCVIIARYEGPVADVGSIRIDIPIGSGTAFSINSLGLMLTNRHVVDAAREIKPPDNLEKLKLPTVTLREIYYVICFGPDPKDRFPAKLLHKSERFDLAVLKVHRRIEHPLILAQKNPRQGDDILVCGYPGAVMAALNASSDTPAHLNDLKQKWELTRHIDAFDEFNPESFSSTLTKGIVSAPDRKVDDASYLQIDAGISPGNSGGPVLNGDNEVVGIATWGLAQAPQGIHASYNFALRVGQLDEEIQPYLKN